MTKARRVLKLLSIGIMIVMMLTILVACDGGVEPPYEIYMPDSMNAQLFRNPKKIKFNLESHGYKVELITRWDDDISLLQENLNWTLTGYKSDLQQITVQEFINNEDAIAVESGMKAQREQDPIAYKYLTFGRIGRVIFSGFEDAVEDMTIKNPDYVPPAPPEVDTEDKGTEEGTQEEVKKP